MNCWDIQFGSSACAYNIQLPWKCKFPWEKESERVPKLVSIDKCLLAEVVGLWERGIKTTGCCCGHGNASPAFIGVAEAHVDAMKALGYVTVPGAEDAFVPKTVLCYGEIQKGFNWWGQ